MVTHIDLKTVLRRTVCELFSNLVTRPTGAAVRGGIEQQLALVENPTLTVIDFSHVGLLDFSCADEIVAKLLLRHGAEADPGHEVYFLFRGISETHLDAIETVLARHRLALVTDDGSGCVRLVGELDDRQRATWEAIFRLGCAVPDDIAGEAGIPAEDAGKVMEDLWRRRLVMRNAQGYVAVGATA
jgi:hypothetical protein